MKIERQLQMFSFVMLFVGLLGAVYLVNQRSPSTVEIFLAVVSAAFGVTLYLVFTAGSEIISLLRKISADNSKPDDGKQDS